MRVGVIFQPFDLKQTIIVTDHNAIVERVEIEYDRIPETVKELASKYSTSEVTLYGNSDYLQKMQCHLLNQYSNLDVTIQSK